MKAQNQLLKMKRCQINYDLKKSNFILLITISTAFYSSLCHGQIYLLAGSYTHTGSKGIYVYEFDTLNGKLTWKSNTNDSIRNPSYLTVSNNGKYVYACTDTRTPNAGSITAFYFNPGSLKLEYLNKQESGGENPVYISINKFGRQLITANYTGGTTAVHTLNKDGSIKGIYQKFGYNGKSIHPDRQTSPHPHCIVYAPVGRGVLTADLGTDKIVQYKRDFKRVGSPLQYDTTIEVMAGSGPRHITFHPNGIYTYVSEELSGTVSAYILKNDDLYLIQKTPTHDSTFNGPYSTADIHVSPDGRFLYVSNRGQENNIAIFSIDEGGKLKIIGYQHTLGIMPRNFALDPTGKYLLVANQESGSVIVFRRNNETGLLIPTSERINIPQVSCLKFLWHKK